MKLVHDVNFDEEIEVVDRHWKIRPGDVVLDVGAAFGSYGLRALRDGASALYAFEPLETHALALEENLAANPGFAERCQVIRRAVGGEEGWFDPSMSVPSEASVPGAREMITLDGWFSSSGVQKIDWLKMDIEGSEAKALAGAKRMIEATRPKILVECHLFMNKDLAFAVSSILWTYGYTVYAEPHHSVAHAYAEPLR